MGNWTPLNDVPPTHRWHGPPATRPERYAQIAGATRFTFDASARIASAGSCFGARIAERLRSANLCYIDAEPGPPSVDAATLERYGYRPFSARFGFVYSSLQLAQLIESAFDLRRAREIAWELGERFVDPLRPRIEPLGFSSVDELLAERETHLLALRRMFAGLDVFVFTVGLNEVCIDREDGTAFPLPPGVAGGTFDESRYAFRNLTVAENVAYFHRFIEVLVSVNPQAKVVLSVSPVPIMGTVSNRHIIIASCYSKSVLRAACEETIYLHENVDYFPSYEMVTQHWAGNDAFDTDGRHVRPEVADLVVDTFVRSYMPAFAPPRVEAQVAYDATTVFPCDEEVLLASASTGSSEPTG